ncbi:MAG: cation transporter, partial [Pseudomonadota bacterium]
MRSALIAISLFIFWMLMSGEWEHDWLIWAGGVLSTAVMGFSLFKGLTDQEGFPIEKLPRAMIYWP